MSKIPFKTKYSDSCHASAFHFHKPTLTNEAFGFDVDINNILQGYSSKAFFNMDSNIKKGVFITADEYEKSLYKLAEAKSMFEELPSHIRERFNNDPKQLLAFVGDSKNDDEAIKLGLKVKSEELNPIKVEVVTSGDVIQSTPPGNSDG